MSVARRYRVGEQEFTRNSEAAEMAKAWGLHVHVLNRDGSCKYVKHEHAHWEMPEQWYWTGAEWAPVLYTRTH